MKKLLPALLILLPLSGAADMIVPSSTKAWDGVKVCAKISNADDFDVKVVVYSDYWEKKKKIKEFKVTSTKCIERAQTSRTPNLYTVLYINGEQAKTEDSMLSPTSLQYDWQFDQSLKNGPHIIERSYKISKTEDLPKGEDDAWRFVLDGSSAPTPPLYRMLLEEEVVDGKTRMPDLMIQKKTEISWDKILPKEDLVWQIPSGAEEGNRCIRIINADAYDITATLYKSKCKSKCNEAYPRHEWDVDKKIKVTPQTCLQIPTRGFLDEGGTYFALNVNKKYIYPYDSYFSFMRGKYEQFPPKDTPMEIVYRIIPSPEIFYSREYEQPNDTGANSFLLVRLQEKIDGQITYSKPMLTQWVEMPYTQMIADDKQAVLDAAQKEAKTKIEEERRARVLAEQETLDTQKRLEHLSKLPGDDRANQIRLTAFFVMLAALGVAFTLKRRQ